MAQKEGGRRLGQKGEGGTLAERKKDRMEKKKLLYQKKKEVTLGNKNGKDVRLNRRPGRGAKQLERQGVVGGGIAIQKSSEDASSDKSSHCRGEA